MPVTIPEKSLWFSVQQSHHSSLLSSPIPSKQPEKWLTLGPERTESAHTMGTIEKLTAISGILRTGTTLSLDSSDYTSGMWFPHGSSPFYSLTDSVCSHSGEWTLCLVLETTPTMTRSSDQ